MFISSPKEIFNSFEKDLELVRRTAYNIGLELGQVLKQRFNIIGDDLESVAEILTRAMRMENGEHTVKIEEDKVILSNLGLCSVINAVQTLDVDWEWLDTNFAWPWLEGIVSSIRNDLILTISTARCRGDPVCTHIFVVK